MILLDAYALVAFITDEPAADDVEPLLRSDDVGIGVVNLAEALDVTQRVRRFAREDVRAAIEPLLARRLRLITHSPIDAWAAADLRVRHYDKRTCAVSTADCFLLASAESGDEIATADPAVATVARAEGVGLIPLPDREGRRP